MLHNMVTNNKHTHSRAVLLLFCVLFFCSSCGQSERTLTKSDAGKSYSDWEQSPAGSAKYLDGDTVFISIFLDDGDGWTASDKALVKKNMQIACDFLKDEGKRYGKEVNLIYDISKHPDLEYHYSMDTPFAGSTLSTHEGDLGKSAKQLRQNIYEYIKRNINIEYVMSKYKVNSIGFLAFIDDEADAATTYSYYLNADISRYYEICFINLRWNNAGSDALKPETYAHEILHLFGARDLYYTDTMTGITREFIDHAYNTHPEDIMLGNSRKGVNYKNKVSGKITDITAYFIGWKETIPELSTFPTISTAYKASFVYSRKRLDNHDEYTLPERTIQEESYRKGMLFRVIRIICYGILLITFIIDFRKRKHLKQSLSAYEETERYEGND